MHPFVERDCGAFSFRDGSRPGPRETTDAPNSPPRSVFSVGSGHQRVLFHALGSAATLGTAAGAYNGLRCSLERARGAEDLANSAVAGSAVFAALGALHMRGNPRGVAAGALLGAVIMPLYDGLTVQVTRGGGDGHAV